MVDGDDGSGGDDRKRYLAALAALAHSYEVDAQGLLELDDDLSRAIAADADLPPPGELAAQLRAMAYQVGTFQRIQAEADRAHDAMLAAGGQDNAEAYTEYALAMQRLAALLPDFKRPDLGT